MAEPAETDMTPHLPPQHWQGAALLCRGLTPLNDGTPDIGIGIGSQWLLRTTRDVILRATSSPNLGIEYYATRVAAAVSMCSRIVFRARDASPVSMAATMS